MYRETDCCFTPSRLANSACVILWVVRYFLSVITKIIKYFLCLVKQQMCIKIVGKYVKIGNSKR